MKVTELDTKEVTVTRTGKRCVLNEKVFDLEECPDWAQCAAVDEGGHAYWYESKPDIYYVYWTFERERSRSKCILGVFFDATNWQHSLIKRPEKVREVTMSDIEKQFGCKVKIVKEA